MGALCGVKRESFLVSGESQIFGVNETQVRALQYYSRAAAQGYAPARVRLGDYYYYGWGEPVFHLMTFFFETKKSDIERLIFKRAEQYLGPPKKNNFYRTFFFNLFIF